MTRLTTTVAITALAIAATVVTAAAEQASRPAERFQAFAVDLGDSGPTRSGFLEIVVTRWMADEEQDALVAAIDSGQDAFLRALQDTRPVGYFRTPSSIGYDLRFVQVLPRDEGGRLIRIVTDRPIDFWEAANRPRSIDYPFTWIELRLDREGNGDGTMFTAAKVTGSGKHKLIVLENYSMQPVRLTNARSMKPPT